MKSKNLIYLLFILAITFVVYLPTNKAKFTNWDDEGYVTQNKDITSFDKHTYNLLTKPYECNYHPLTMLSLALDYSIGKLKPSVYHRTNLILHLANGVLVFCFLLLLFKNSEIALIGALGFGIHPMNVESVAWVSERKNVLYTFFFFASLIAYVQYINMKKYSYYFMALFLFLLSLFSKGMAVSLSMSLLAIDWYTQRGFDRKSILEKIPFFILSFLFGYIAIVQQPLKTLEIDVNRQVHLAYSLFEKLLVAFHNLGLYFVKLIVPIDLAAFYPYPNQIPLSFYFTASVVIGVLFVLGYLLLKHKIDPSNKILFAVLFFVFNIALVLQFIPVGDAIRADRYAYIPSVGFFIVVAAGYSYATSNYQKWKSLLIILLSAWGFGLAYQANARCKVWHDSVSLWTDQIEKYPNHGFSYNQRGHARDEKNDLEGALADYKKCIELDPAQSKAYNNIGVIETTNGHYDTARAYFDKSIALNNKNDFAYKNRGRANYLAGNHNEAIRDYTSYLKFDTSDYSVYLTRGYSYSVLNDFKNALADYDKAIRLEPAMAQLYIKRGTLKSMNSNFRGALHDFDKAIELESTNIEVYVNRAIIKSIMSDFDGALLDFNKALALNPDFAEGYRNRAKTYFSKGLKNEACQDFQKAIELGSTDAANDLKAYCE